MIYRVGLSSQSYTKQWSVSICSSGWIGSLKAIKKNPLTFALCLMWTYDMFAAPSKHCQVLMVGMLASRFVLGGRSPQCTGSSTAFTRSCLSPLRCCTRKSGISACYSQHPSCWQYVGAAVDCKNTVLFQLRSITDAVYCWAVNDTYVISSLAFKVSLK